MYERDVFNISIEELEAGERPGWLKRVVVTIEGEKATMRFDVHWEISRLRAKWILIKQKFKVFVRVYLR